jgi:hypothetical protein
MFIKNVPMRNKNLHAEMRKSLKCPINDFADFAFSSMDWFNSGDIRPIDSIDPDIS